MNKFKNYAISIIIPLALGAIVGFIISGSMDYDMLKQPPLSPPGVLFPIVWTVLYVLMGVSYGILRQNSLNDSDVKLIYYVQLVVNLLWPLAFFLLKWRLFAFIWLLFLIALVVMMILTFLKRNKTAAYLQIPYLVWTVFAAYLNLGVYILNR